MKLILPAGSSMVGIEHWSVVKRFKIQGDWLKLWYDLWVSMEVNEWQTI